MKTFIRTSLLTSIAILVLLGGSTAAFADTSQQLSMAATGGVTYLGTQTYTVAGGAVEYAAVNGQTLTHPHLSYYFQATQAGADGAGTSGYGTLTLTGRSDGARVTVTGSFGFDTDLPLTTIGTDLPGFFVSYAPNVYITTSGSTQPLGQALTIESPYLNPFGGPIVIATADDGATLTIVATYTTGNIYWQGTQVGGELSGTLGSTPVTGMLSLTSNENENLVAGTAYDRGTISFSGMTPSSLNVNGNYQGTDYIPTTGAIDCSSEVTFIEGTCYETGFQSQGSFNAQGIYGSYNTQWGVPAIGFYTVIQATLPQTGSSGQPGNYGNGWFGFGGFNWGNFFNHFHI